MGLFDTLVVKAPLPLPEFEGRKFQTKDLGKHLYFYEVQEDGRLHHPKGDQTWPNFTGSVVFYTFVNEEAPSGWVEFRGKFVDGRMVSVETIAVDRQ